MSRVNYIAAICAAILLSDGCGHNGSRAADTWQMDTGQADTGQADTKPTDTKSAVSGGSVSGETDIISDSAEENREEVLRQKALEQAEAMDFTIQESPVDRERYAPMDQAYKEAFLKAVTNQIPIHRRDGEEPVLYRDLLKEAGKLPEDQFLRAVRESDYFYQDFDGDGLPELTVDTEGPCVLKYHPEEDRVELYAQKEEGWRLLGKGQMYAEFTESDEEARTNLYCYESGEEKFCLKTILYWYWRREQEPYLVSRGEYTDMAVEEETAQKLKGDYSAAGKEAPGPMTFSAVFGDGENCGYMPGEEIPVRYGLRDTDILPVNDESGEEWEVYRAMMEGDFSVVEGEDWGKLQGDYEEELEDNNGICGWNYFLMDFNQDGIKELVIRFYPGGVNNIASFCCEDGRIRMWGNYGSADSHGYWLPLANGKTLSVYWYQDNRDWWVNRVDSQCGQIREQYYCTWVNQEESDGREGEERERFYGFQDYYHNGKICGSLVGMTEEEWRQIEEGINRLMIPEEVWKPCSVFTPKPDRPEVPGVG